MIYYFEFISYANLFMADLEQDFLDSQFDKPSLWLRFIDNIFLLWPHGPDSLTVFLKQLNSRYPVHFTLNTSPSHITFLDVVCIDHGQFQHLSMLYPPTPNNISTITAATPHQPNTPFLTPLSLEGVTSITTLMTSTLTPPTSIEASPAGATQSLSSKNSYSMASTSPTPLASPRTPITCLSSPSQTRILREGFHILSSDSSTQDLLTEPPSVP